jgi:hypothetical protein
LSALASAGLPGLVAGQGDAGAEGLDALLAGSPEEPIDDAGGPGAGPPGPEVFKAGRWDRARGNGAGFASGGVADDLPPGPTLAGLAGDAWDQGLERLSDDELIGVLRAARRLASWASAMELSAAGDLWRRRTDEEAAGDTGAGELTGDEIAAALTLTGRSADQLLDLAIGLRRLPMTSAALTAGDIDVPRAIVIAQELAGLTDEHAAAVERAVLGAAPHQTTGQLRRATHRAVLATDPAAARQRKEQAQREARVERWTEPAGTAALAGRDLPPADVLAADANLTALAKQLKATGAEGTMDTLRAKIYLALLTGTPAALAVPTAPAALVTPVTDEPSDDERHDNLTGPGDAGRPRHGGRRGAASPGNGGQDGAAGPGDAGQRYAASPDDGGRRGAASPGDGGRWSAASPDNGGHDSAAGPGEFPGLGGAGISGRVNLTMPLSTWLGCSDAPGQVAGYGPLDATDSRTVADALAARADSTWCLTFTDADGTPVAHGCARARPAAGQRRAPPTARSPDKLAAQSRPQRASDKPAARVPATGDKPTAQAPATGAKRTARAPATWTFTVSLLERDPCSHARQTAAYRPSPGLRHLIEVRQATCTFPGCLRPATRCDKDHTVPYHLGGRTCECNLAPLCRRHHAVKQARGWTLEQSSPGVMTWTTPAGRRYTITPTRYPGE